MALKRIAERIQILSTWWINTLCISLPQRETMTTVIPKILLLDDDFRDTARILYSQILKKGDELDRWDLNNLVHLLQLLWPHPMQVVNFHAAIVSKGFCFNYRPKFWMYDCFDAQRSEWDWKFSNIACESGLLFISLAKTYRDKKNIVCFVV